jgi:hypothetical protein
VIKKEGGTFVGLYGVLKLLQRRYSTMYGVVRWYVVRLHIEREARWKAIDKEIGKDHYNKNRQKNV